MKKVLSLFVAVSSICSFAGLPQQAHLAFAGQTINIIDNAMVDHRIYGNGPGPNGTLPSGYASDLLDPNNNTVNIINSSTTSNYSVYGGSSGRDNTTVNGNNVTITGSTIGRSIYGGETGYSNQGYYVTVNGNNVTITSSTIGEDVYGANVYAGLSGSSLTVNGNNVTITDSTIGGNVYGGYSRVGSIKIDSNNVSIIDSVIGSNIYGGYSESNTFATVSCNNVAVTGATIGGNVYGGYIGFNFSHVSGASGSAAANGNNVTITGSSMDSVYGGIILGSMYGAVSGSNTASNNTIVITSGTVSNEVYGGYVSVDFGSTAANGNNVTITGGTTGSVYGGRIFGSMHSAAPGGSNTANNNTIIITSGTVNNEVYGGYVSVDFGSAAAINNTVTIGGVANVSGAILYGGCISGGIAGDAISGNTLNVMNKNMSVKGIENFENYNFYLDETVAGADQMLSVDNSVDMTNSTVGIFFSGKTTALNVGENVELIVSGTGLDVTGINTTAYVVSGVKLYTFDLAKFNSDRLVATLAEAGTNPQTKALSEGQLGGLAFLNQASDLISNSGISSAIQSVGNSDGLTVFATMGGGSAEYETGSSVKVSGFSIMGGIARQMSEKITAGAFIEGGWGNYDSYNSFNSVASVDGNGNNSYYGLGFLGRYDISDVWYSEGSLRAGFANTDFNSADFIGYSNVNYETSAIYYGAHIGAGFFHKFNDKLGLDISGKLFYTGQGADDVTIEGDKVEFDTANSMRARFGGRVNYTVKQSLMPYAGAYLDYEFDGKAEATVNGAEIEAPELQGATGVGELGVTLTPSNTMPLTLDIGLQGYSGARKGFSAALQVRYMF